MNLSEINWDIEASGTWPLPVKAVITLILCTLVAGGGVYYFTLDQLNELDRFEKKEQELRSTFSTKQKKAVNLPEYKNQLDQIEASLEEMIKQMPTEEEVASLLVDISQTGLASGLEFKLFKPSAPIRQDFYSELPITIQVLGRYEELGLFVSGLASLPRIVTVHNIHIAPASKEKGRGASAKVSDGKGKDGTMVMDAVIKTYNEGGPTASQGTASKKKRGKKR